jgi:hypothetical protein
MNIIITIFIFAIVLFIYLHIYYHIKTSNDLEVFELTNLSKNRLEEVCNLRQPLTFYLDINCFNILNINEIEKTYNSFDIKIRDISGNSNSELYLPIVFRKARSVIKKSKNYYSELNQDFLNETNLIKTFRLNDFFLRPSSLMTASYDYIMGSADVTTPFRYDISYRNFFLVLDGSITIKLTPPKNIKYLYPDYDYDNLEFRSLINPWNIQKEYKNDFNKIKCLDVNLNKGKVIFIPAYWWYSIKFNTSETVILNFKYKTYMNNVAILPHYIKYFLQKQNIKHNIIKNIKTS